MKQDFFGRLSEVVSCGQIKREELLSRHTTFRIGGPADFFVENGTYHNFFITILSFGFKHGIPEDSDLVFDVRFLKNPYYVPELKKLTGKDQRVRDYVLSSAAAYPFLDKLEDMLRFLIPGYIAEGKNQLVVSIGCTGGKHRSVTVAYELEKRLAKTEYGVKTEHRDILK